VDCERRSQLPSVVNEVRQRLARCPLEGQVVEFVFFAVLVRLNNALVLNPSSVPGLA
jgi:hypothetical protein